MNRPLRLRPSAREVALDVVRDVFSPHQRAAQAAFDYRARYAELDARDRAFATELAYGAIKMRRLLDWYAAPYLAERPKPLPSAIAEILRLGIYQVILMNGVDAHAAVFETVKLALRHGHRGTAGLVNAILRRVTSEHPLPPDPSDFQSDDDFLGTRYSLPSWVVARLRAGVGAQLDTVLSGLNAAPQHAVRVNALRTEVSAVRATLGAAGRNVRNSAFVPEVLLVDGGPVFDDRDGAWAVQSESAAIPVDVLAPAEGERILELCSGRGNKSVQIGARIAGRGTLTCVELDRRKVQRLTETLTRAGVENAAVVEADGRALALEEPVDAVLVDAPCSGLGILGRHAEARWRKAPSDAERLRVAQAELLEAGARHVRPGGRLVYGVCSTDALEGSTVVGDFLQRNAAFERAGVPARYAQFAAPDGDVLVPPGVDGRDGFFVAALRRAPA
jgi:16S rRNA (cytosine967-C5)-methyltransferase